MAKLTDCGVLDYDLITDYKIDDETIDTMLGLLSFPIVDEKINDDGITISVFEKSFWGKKPKGYITLKYIEDAQFDTTINGIEDSIAEIAAFNKGYYDEDEPVHEFSKILIGFEFSSPYANLSVNSYKLGNSRNGVLSYSLLIHNIHVKYDACCKIQMEELNNFGSVRERLISKRCDEIRELESKFQFFEKLKAIKA